MVLLSASICTKSGKAVVARQFMEISRSRIEGLLAAFPKLIDSDEQHTFVETDSVRYVYQPMESLYMILITTKNSNILEDLETLRLFAKVVPDYCRTMTAEEVQESAFSLIFAFDEIVALGYRENVNMSQIRTFTEMDSHDENIYKMVQKNKEREAAELAKRRAKELNVKRKMEQRLGGGGGGGGGYSGGSGGGGGGYSSSSSYTAPRPASTSSSSTSAAAPKPAATKKPGRGWKLGGKPKTNDFVDALIAEGEHVAADEPDEETNAPQRIPIEQENTVPTKSIHVSIDEKIFLAANRDGGVEQMEVKGFMFLNVTDESLAKLRINIDKSDGRQVSVQTHPNVDKKLYANGSQIGLKNSAKGFPLDTQVGVLKWRFVSTDESDIPMTVNCWPTVNSDGSCDVNIDYELQAEDLELQDVVISIPVPGGVGQPTIGSVDGDYNFDSRNSTLDWSIPVINAENPEGSLEFSIRASDADQFFPVQVDFTSSKTFAGIKIVDVVDVEGSGSLDFSTDVTFHVDSYEFV